MFSSTEGLESLIESSSKGSGGTRLGQVSGVGMAGINAAKISGGKGQNAHDDDEQSEEGANEQSL